MSHACDSFPTVIFRRLTYPQVSHHAFASARIHIVESLSRLLILGADTLREGPISDEGAVDYRSAVVAQLMPVTNVMDVRSLD